MVETTESWILVKTEASNIFLFISLLAQRNSLSRAGAEGKQRKGTFSKGFFIPSARDENHKEPAKFSPGLRKFLTPVLHYPAEKVYGIYYATAAHHRQGIIKINEKHLFDFRGTIS
ncbi:MAG: hypothetical protein RQ761_13170 [Bacteroidales bacterium]|nr:hypothetical protein [Bacteroidales bacterium]